MSRDHLSRRELLARAALAPGALALAGERLALAAERHPDTQTLRGKPHIQVGTLGHVDHGKTTLTAAILKTLAESGGSELRSYEEIDEASEERAHGLTFSAARVDYESAARRFTHIDCPRHADYVKSLLTGAGQIEGAILVVSAADGVMPQTREHIHLARQTGVKDLVVFLNKCDRLDDESLIGPTRLEVGELLRAQGYPDEDRFFVGGSALFALASGSPTLGANRKPGWGVPAIHRLLAAMDWFSPPVRPDQRPFLMAIAEVFPVPGRGAVVAGRIERGRIELGQWVEIVGLRDPRKARVIGIEMSRRPRDEGRTGEKVGLLLEVGSANLERGQVLAAPRSIRAHARFTAEAYVFTTAEGGRRGPFFSGYRPRFLFRSRDVTGTVSLAEGHDMAMPGDNVALEVALDAAVAMEPGLRIAIREGGRAVGAGVVARVLD